MTPTLSGEALCRPEPVTGGGIPLGKATLLALLVLVPLLPAPTHAAGVGCLRVDAAAFDEIHIQGPLDGFVGWSVALGLTKDRLPMTPTLLAVQGEAVCDLTQGLAAFAGTPRTPIEAASLALLAVGAIHVDVLPDPVAQGEIDVHSTPAGYVATFDVWTPRNGVVATTTVAMGKAIDVQFVVQALAVGAFTPAVEGWNLLPGDTQETLVPDMGAQATKIITAQNADGTTWRVTYFTQRYASEAEADHHAQMHLGAALRAYENQTAWGFTSRDPDRILDLTLDGCDCIYREANANIHMFPRANDILPLVPGLAYRSEEEVAEIIVGHELFHHMQYGLMQWRHGAWLIEGMARFQETAHWPEATFLPTTLTYYWNLNGMNGFMADPTGTIASHSYDWSLVWGWLYAHEGGMPLLKAVLEEANVGGNNPDVDGPDVIQRAMDRVPGGEHATFAESYAAFARALLTRDGFVWGKPDGTGVHDWATYLDPVGRHNSLASSYSHASWGIRVVNARPQTLGDDVGILYTPHAALKADVYALRDGEESFTPATQATFLADVDDAALLVVRPGPPTGSVSYVTIVTR